MVGAVVKRCFRDREYVGMNSAKLKTAGEQIIIKYITRDILFMMILSVELKFLEYSEFL